MNTERVYTPKATLSQLEGMFESLAWQDVIACMQCFLEDTRDELEALDVVQMRTMSLRGEAKAIREFLDLKHRMLTAAEQADENFASDRGGEDHDG